MTSSTPRQPILLSDDQVIERFHHAGVRVTRQRTLIYRLLVSLDTHPTAEELLTTVRHQDERLSLATVYNTLDTLVENGLVQRIAGSISGGACRFEADTSEHVHMVMPDGRVRDVPMDLSAQIMNSIPADALEQLCDRMGVSVQSIKIDLVCSQTGE
ncbi:MAG: transcriptional repressor [Phycisphaerales bacterium]|nr:transcriptional repressor [Phycisphaerales bacterium]